MVVIWNICYLLAVIISQRRVTGTKGHVGSILNSTTEAKPGIQGIFIMEDKVIPTTSAVYLFSANMSDTYPVWFQVWRPINIELKLYKLIGQVRFAADLVPKVYNIPVPWNTPIIAQKDDVVAIYNEGNICPVAYKFQAHSPTYHHSVQERAEIIPEFEALFGRTSFPYQFSVKAYYDTDVQKYVSPGNIQTTDQNPTRQTIPPRPNANGTMLYVGNDLSVEKTSFLKDSAQGMFVFPNLVLRTGIIIKLYGYFVKVEQVEFQVWRPHQERNGAFILVGQYKYVPDLVPQVKQINLSPSNYIFVQEGDILGFTYSNNLGPIGYTFMDNPTTGPYRASIVQSQMPLLGEVVNFNMNRHPYDFAFGVMYDTDLDPLKYGTSPPNPSYVPPSSQPLNPERPSEKPEQTLPPLVINVPKDFLLLGKDNLNIASRVLQDGAMRSFLLLDLIFPTSGYIDSFAAYIVKGGTVHFQIWRPVQVLQTYKLIARKEFVIDTGQDGIIGEQLLYFNAQEDNIFVRAGDVLGFANAQQYSVVGYQFLIKETTQLYSSVIGLTANLSDVVNVDMMPFPYKFALGAIYREGEEISVVTTPTDITDDDISTPVKSGNPEPEPEPVAEDVDISWVMDSRFVFGLFIWLIVMSILFLILSICICVICCRYKNREEVKRTSFLYDYESKNSVTRPPSAYLSNTQNKGNETMNYFNPKTGSKSGPVMRNDSMKEQLIEGDEPMTATGSNTRGVRSGYDNTNNNNTRAIQSISEIESDFDDTKVRVIGNGGSSGSGGGDVSTYM